MARAQFPEEEDRASISGPPGTVVTITTDERGRTPANIQTYPGGAAIGNSQVVLDANGLIPYFLSPDPAPDILYGFSPGSSEGAVLNKYRVKAREYVLVDGGPP